MHTYIHTTSDFSEEIEAAPPFLSLYGAAPMPLIRVAKSTNTPSSSADESDTDISMLRYVMYVYVCMYVCINTHLVLVS